MTVVRVNEAIALMRRLDLSKPWYMPRRMSIKAIRNQCTTDHEVVAAVRWGEANGWTILGQLNYSEARVEEIAYQRSVGR